MVWKRNSECLRAAFVALVLPVLLAGCTATPDTAFNWGVDTSYRNPASYSHPSASNARRSYAYEERVPQPRPKPRSYYDEDRTSSAMPRHRYNDDVEQAQLPDSAIQFGWPLKGRVLSNFGTTEDGERNDGINIATDYGEPIHAAAAGVVTYAGNELKGYGNLVLIRHQDGYVTAYAHAERVLVQRGDQVAKGQVIGYAGDTGDVTEPQLHFEIRQGVRPLNPRPLLVASR